MIIRNQRAFAAGAILMSMALFFFVVSLNYTLGSVARMGPSYFPRMLSILLGMLSLVIMAGAVTPGATIDRLAKWDMKALLWIVGSVGLFAFLLRPMGIVAALSVLIIVSSLASSEFTWRGTLANVVVLTAVCIGVFILGLGLHIPLWPTFEF